MLGAHMGTAALLAGAISGENLTLPAPFGRQGRAGTHSISRPKLLPVTRRIASWTFAHAWPPCRSRRPESGSDAALRSSQLGLRATGQSRARPVPAGAAIER